MKLIWRLLMSDLTSDEPSPPEEPSNLRFLRLLVTTLTAVMICGLVVIITLLVIRLTSDTVPQLPQDITLPKGASAIGITAAQDWYAIVTDDNRILIYQQGSGALLQTITVSGDGADADQSTN